MKNELKCNGSQARFSKTRWSVIISARAKSSPVAEAALNKLCEIYWYPVYAFLRRKGYTPHQAEDLTQSFFANVLQREWLKNVGPEKGRFRTFLLRCLQNFSLNNRDCESHRPVTIDFSDAEARYGVEPVTKITPERLMELRWATTVLDQALNRLKNHYIQSGKKDRFEVLVPYLSKETAPGAFGDASARLALSEEATRQEASRMRKAYREAIRSEIAETVANPEEVEDEQRYLRQLFAQ